MNTKEAIKASMDMGLMVLNSYVSDLSDADLLSRPSPGCNHLAWQLGHLIASEVSLLNSICPGKGAELPPGFADQHGKDKTGMNDASQFCTKAEYQALYEQVRTATAKALTEMPDADLDGPSPEHFRQMFPTVGHVMTLIGNHPMMHAGQFAVARRNLGKPVLI